MTSSRLELAFPARPEGRVLLLGATAAMAADLRRFDPGRCWIVQPFAPDHDALKAQGFQVSPDMPDQGDFDLAVVFLPRARAQARSMVHGAASRLAQGGSLWIDGLKNHGVDSMLREIRALHPVEETHSKAHGKIFRLEAGDWVPLDWAARPGQAAPGFTTVPGVFSADGIDPGSALLAAALPERMPTRMVDLGAGWGWLSAQVLARSGVEVLHLVEADHAALQSARANISDPRAQFHWADARGFSLSEPVNGVVMNPPFHSGRDADPGLGQAFIASAARLLTGAGRLWMVANRHLPYEAALARYFAKVAEIGGDGRFKVIEATGANRGQSNHPKGGRR